MTARAQPLFVLDLGNVLLEVDFSRFGDRLRLAGVGGAAEIAAGIVRSAEKAAFDRGHLAVRAFADFIVGRCPGSGLDADGALDAWASIFSPVPGAEDAVRHLARVSELWLFSDTDPVHFTSALNDFELLRAGFARYLVSFVRGRLKRDPGAFELLRREVRSGRGLVFVDDLAANVAAARAVGVEALLFRDWPDTERELRRSGRWP